MVFGNDNPGGGISVAVLVQTGANAPRSSALCCAGWVSRVVRLSGFRSGVGCAGT